MPDIFSDEIRFPDMDGVQLKSPLDWIDFNLREPDIEQLLSTFDSPRATDVFPVELELGSPLLATEENRSAIMDPSEIVLPEIAEMVLPAIACETELFSLNQSGSHIEGLPKATDSSPVADEYPITFEIAPHSSERYETEMCAKSATTNMKYSEKLNAAVDERFTLLSGKCRRL